MELCMVGLFFLVRDVNDNVACKVQAIIMIVVTGLTMLYQYLLNEAFGPLFKYIPISLEDTAVERDIEFAEAQRKRFGSPRLAEEKVGDTSAALGEGQRQEREARRAAEAIELKQLHGNKHREPSPHRLLSFGDSTPYKYRPPVDESGVVTSNDHMRKYTNDLESQPPSNIGKALFDGIPDEIEDLSPHDRDLLVQRAFQHEAIRAKRPVIWIPRDNLGISDDEVYRTQRFSKHIWISNEYTGLDSKCRVVYRRSPPDFSELDLIEL